MAYTYANIESQVRININDTGAVVQEEIDQAISLLSNFFQLKKIDTSISSVANQGYINKPTNAIEIVRVKLGSDDYEEVKISELAKVEMAENKKWYDWNDKIQITPTPTSIMNGKIWYKAGFTPLGGAGTTDIPDRLVPLVILLATWIYWLEIVTKTGTMRELYPDMTPKEACETANTWLKQINSVMEKIKETKQI